MSTNNNLTFTYSLAYNASSPYLSATSLFNISDPFTLFPTTITALFYGTLLA